MSVRDLGSIQIPPGVAAWIDKAIIVFLALFVLWVVLKVIGYALRRSYNLTPVATAPSRDIKPDFLKVDHAAEKQMLQRGREFERTRATALQKATSATSLGVIVSGLITFVTAGLLALGQIEELDTTWRELSTKDRFVAIVESHPVGFAVALAMIVAAFIRLAMTFRRPK